MSFKSFLISKSFFKNLGVMILFGLIMIFVVIKALDFYTDNGAFVIIPNIESCDADSLIVLSSKDYLQYEITDSTYAVDRIPGIVLRQHPTSGARVKKGRTVYLSVVAKMPEMIAMPNLIDLSLRRAIDVLKHSSLEVEKIEYTNDIALNAVLKQQINQKDVPSDSLLSSYTKISLIVGNGFNRTKAAVPFLIGKDAQGACDMILKSSFNIGNIDTVVEEEYQGWKVYKQYPHADPHHPETLPLGSKISFLLRSEKHINFDSLLILYHTPDSLNHDSLMNKQEPIDF